MKKQLLFPLFVALLFLSFNVGAQTNNDAIKEVLTNKGMSITWLGADFSHAVILDMSDCSAADFISKIAPAINELVLIEPNKFDFAKFLQKKSCTTDIVAVTKSNAATNLDDMVDKDTGPVDLKQSTIKEIVGKYDLSGKEGVGVVLIYESLSKRLLKSTMYLTYVKMPEGEIILSRQVEGKAGGFGLRNYWAATIYSFLKYYDRYYLPEWKANYKIK